ncbi:hypothetical protein K402DRAFT_160115 [Aulographum hederae CBS 113979]|uniref:Uncharacterized protein n=1 Tax=Aulographum hederae CBS 113979 TaxID=1176131 RepID=A0A6G1GSE3_9PEZI|nr:hypothetical protein K402DRAFT_160115 [Aulographum hederae CBS 113979]
MQCDAVRGPWFEKRWVCQCRQAQAASSTFQAKKCLPKCSCSGAWMRVCMHNYYGGQVTRQVSIEGWVPLMVELRAHEPWPVWRFLSHEMAWTGWVGLDGSWIKWMDGSWRRFECFDGSFPCRWSCRVGMMEVSCCVATMEYSMLSSSLSRYLPIYAGLTSLGNYY